MECGQTGQCGLNALKPAMKAPDLVTELVSGLFYGGEECPGSDY